MPDKIRVAVVFGGRSTEHSVSCASASMVLAALDPSRYEVVPIGITRDGRWVLTSGDPGRLGPPGSGSGSGSDDSLPSLPSVADVGASVVPVGGSFQVIAPDSVPRSLGDVDVVLPLLHGAYGEDGTIQGLLELTGTRYVGAGVLASAAGMDKAYMKLLLAADGLPIGPYVVVRDRDWRSGSVERKRVLDEILELGLPVFVKPARGGSSIGITRVTSWAALEPAIEAARAHDPKVLVEAALDGVEVECAVLEGEDGGPPEASVPGQVLVDAASDFYDFEAKYLVAGATMRVPADVPDPVAAEIRRLACASFDALGCEGLARVDFFYTSAGQVVINEINTMPGMTAASGFPMMWAATGLPMAELMDRIIRTALAKRPGLRLIDHQGFYVPWHVKPWAVTVNTPGGAGRRACPTRAGGWCGRCGQCGQCGSAGGRAQSQPHRGRMLAQRTGGGERVAVSGWRPPGRVPPGGHAGHLAGYAGRRHCGGCPVIPPSVGEPACLAGGLATSSSSWCC